jgi:hypothetical protein
MLWDDPPSRLTALRRASRITKACAPKLATRAKAGPQTLKSGDLKIWRPNLHVNKSPNRFPGGHRSRVTPVPIPNTEVKPATADGTARVGGWESRSLPGIHCQKPAGSVATSGLLAVPALPRDRHRGCLPFCGGGKAGSSMATPRRYTASTFRIAVRSIAGLPLTTRKFATLPGTMPPWSFNPKRSAAL